MIRNSRDFRSTNEYKEFPRALLVHLNGDRLRSEMQYLRPLPERRLESDKRERVRVDSGSLIYVERNAYSVNSRLIGEKVEARLGSETIEVWYAGRNRHIIDWLVRKHGAFENYRCREELFPTSRFRMAWDTA